MPLQKTMLVRLAAWPVQTLLAILAAPDIEQQLLLLKKVALDEVLREALLFTNPSFYQRIEGIGHINANTLNKKDRQTMHTLLQYVARMAFKVSPLNRLGVVGFVTLAQTTNMFQADSLGKRCLKLTQAVQNQWRSQLQNAPDQVLFLRLNPSAKAIEDGSVIWICFNSESQNIFNVEDFEAPFKALVEIFEGSENKAIAYAVIVQRLAFSLGSEEQDLEEMMDLLIENGLLQTGIHSRTDFFAAEMGKLLHTLGNHSGNTQSFETAIVQHFKTFDLPAFKFSTLRPDQFLSMDYKILPTAPPYSTAEKEVLPYLDTLNALCELSLSLQQNTASVKAAQIAELMAGDEELNFLDFYQRFHAAPCKEVTTQAKGINLTHQDTQDGVLHLSSDQWKLANDTEVEVSPFWGALYHPVPVGQPIMLNYLVAGNGKMWNRFEGPVDEMQNWLNSYSAGAKIAFIDAVRQYDPATRIPYAPVGIQVGGDVYGAENSVGLKDLVVKKNRNGRFELLLAKEPSIRIIPMDFDIIRPELMPSIYTLLLCFSPITPTLSPILTNLLPFYTQTIAPGVTFLPRLIVDKQVCLHRATWHFNSDSLPLASAEELQKYLLVYSIPTDIFVRVGSSKPQYFNLKFNMYADMLWRLLRNNEGDLQIQEMYPTPLDIEKTGGYAQERVLHWVK